MGVGVDGLFVGLTEVGFAEVGSDVEGMVVGLEEKVGLADVGSAVGGDVGIGIKPKLFGDLTTYNPCPIPLMMIMPEVKNG